jgi:hypothetical protein
MKTLLAIITSLALCGAASAADPMRIKIRTTLPERITTVGPAAQYYADVIGYRLTTADPAPAESGRIAQRSISPLVDRDKVLPVEEAILALLDPDCRLVIDHAHKLYTFERMRGEP